MSSNGSVKEIAQIIENERKPEVREAGELLIAGIQQIELQLPEKLKGKGAQLALRALTYCQEKALSAFTPESFFRAVLKAAEFGLAIDGRLAYALPRKGSGGKELHFAADYKGMVAVARERGVVKDCYARVYREGDKLEQWEDELGSHFRYSQAVGKRGKPLGALAILVFKDGTRRIEFMEEDELEECRKAAQTDNVWNRWGDEMRKKSVIRRALKGYQDSDAVFSEFLKADADAYDLDEPARKREYELDLDADTEKLSYEAAERTGIKAEPKRREEELSLEDRAFPGADVTPEEEETIDIRGEYMRLAKLLHSRGLDVRERGYQVGDSERLGARELGNRIREMKGWLRDYV